MQRQLVNERRADNPSLEFIQHAARVLGVPAGELIGSELVKTRNRPGSPSQLQVRIDKVKQLPRKEQEFVIKFLDTVLERSGLQ